MEKHVLVNKMFTNRLNMDLPPWAWIKETVHEVETYRLSNKEKVLGTIVNKKKS